MNPEPEILGIGIALLLGNLAGLWKSASMRGDLFDKWNERIDVSEAGLSERAAEELIRLHITVSNSLLPTAGVAFDPTRLVVDPGNLMAIVKRFERFLNARENLGKRFRGLLNLGPALVVVLITSVLAIAMAFSYLGGLTEERTIGVVGISLGAGSFLGGAAILIRYIYLQHTLSSAEILSAKGHERE